MIARKASGGRCDASSVEPGRGSILARSGSASESFAQEVEVTRIAACPRRDASALPDDLPSTLRAVVEIQVGSLGGTGVIVSPDGWVLTAAHCDSPR